MGIVFALAAGILWLLGKFTLRGLTGAEKKASADRRSARWHRVWIGFYIAMAAISLPINLIGMLRKTAPLFPTIVWVVLAIIVLLGVLNPYKGDNAD